MKLAEETPENGHATTFITTSMPLRQPGRDVEFIVVYTSDSYLKPTTLPHLRVSPQAASAAGRPSSAALISAAMPEKRPLRPHRVVTGGGRDPPSGERIVMENIVD